MSEQDGRITRKEYYKIGLEEIRENNHIKNIQDLRRIGFHAKIEGIFPKKAQ